MIIHDFEFDNAILFGQYVLVYARGIETGRGLVKKYNKQVVLVGAKVHPRKSSTFIRVPPPQILIDFV